MVERSVDVVVRDYRSPLLLVLAAVAAVAQVEGAKNRYLADAKVLVSDLGVVNDQLDLAVKSPIEVVRSLSVLA